MKDVISGMDEIRAKRTISNSPKAPKSWSHAQALEKLHNLSFSKSVDKKTRERAAKKINDYVRENS